MRAQDAEDRKDHPVWICEAEMAVHKPQVCQVWRDAAGGGLMSSFKGAVFPALVTALLGFTLVESIKPSIPPLAALLDILAIYVWALVFLVSIKKYFLGGCV